MLLNRALSFYNTAAPATLERARTQTHVRPLKYHVSNLSFDPSPNIIIPTNTELKDHSVVVPTSFTDMHFLV